MGESVIPDPLPESVIPDPLPQNVPPTGSISQAPSGVGAWLNSAENDVRYGGTSTMLGKLLSAAGAPGINRGVSEGAADQIAGPLIGPIKAAQGVSEMGQHPVVGALKALAGGIQTASPALAFMAPEAAEGLGNLPPSRPYASQLFQQLMQKLGPVKADISEPMAAAQEIVKAKSQGGQMPAVVRAFLKRAQDADNPADYEFIRGLYSNATRLSSNEFSNLNPNTQRLLGKFTQALGSSAQGVAESQGVGPVLHEAMQNYSQGSKVVRAMKQTGKIAAIGVGAGTAEQLAQRAIQKAMR